MSVADLQAFLGKAAKDEALRDQLHAAGQLDDIVDLAAQHGHSIDKPAVLRAHGQALASASDHQLSGISSWGDALMHAFGATEAD
jgi:predicted ribosomally synthesized peptide with nif11-like leader